MKFKCGDYTLLLALSDEEVLQRIKGGTTEIPFSVVKTKETLCGVVASVVNRTVRLNTGKAFDIEASLPLPVVGDPVVCSVREGAYCVSWGYEELIFEMIRVDTYMREIRIIEGLSIPDEGELIVAAYEPEYGTVFAWEYVRHLPNRYQVIDAHIEEMHLDETVTIKLRNGGLRRVQWSKDAGKAKGRMELTLTADMERVVRAVDISPPCPAPTTEVMGR